MENNIELDYVSVVSCLIGNCLILLLSDAYLNTTRWIFLSLFAVSLYWANKSFGYSDIVKEKTNFFVFVLFTKPKAMECFNSHNFRVIRSMERYKKKISYIYVILQVVVLDSIDKQQIACLIVLFSILLTDAMSVCNHTQQSAF